MMDLRVVQRRNQPQTSKCARSTWKLIYIMAMCGKTLLS